MNTEFSLAKKMLQELITEFSPLGELSNEAQTRFQFIDRLLIDCLGWARTEIKVEVFENGDRSDYECGDPRQLILEAKRAGKCFEIPPRRERSSKKMKLRSLMEFNVETKNGLEQVQKYCQDRGVALAALCNGPQLILFLASRVDGKPPLEGDAFVFESYEALYAGFDTVFDCLSVDGVAEKRALELLGGDGATNLPPKLSSNCINYFAYKYSSPFQENLRNASAMVIEDVGNTSEYQKDFLRECYCESGPLTQFSLLGKNILSARYAALFSNTETASRTEEVNPRKGEIKFGDRAIAEALARRPLILLGDVGVGKTSFIKNLIQVDAKEQFDGVVFTYLDLGSKASLSRDVKDALHYQIEQTLKTEHKVNLQDSNLIERIYKSELEDFDTGYMASLRADQPAYFQQKRTDHIQRLISDRTNHLRSALEDLAKSRRKQIVIVIDNADQRSILIQQEAFVIAHELASSWNALVFLALRPQTFHASKRSGTISAYPPKVFVISPPKLEEAIEKRLSFALKVSEGKLPFSKAQDLSMHVESLAILIKSLQFSLKTNSSLYEFLVNVSSGNVRVAVELISKFLGNPNVDTERIVKIFSETGSYTIPMHEFSKGGLLGELAYFQESASNASNLFSVVYADKREHFLTFFLLGFLSWDGAGSSEESGFVGFSAVVSELQEIGFRPEQTTAHLQRLVRKKLVETTERRLLELDEELKDGMPKAYRLTPLGAYHLKKWAYDFSYIEAMSFDTPIFDQQIRGELLLHVNEQALWARYERALRFRDYLTDVWSGFTAKPYFSWSESISVGQSSFDRAKKRLNEHGTSQ